jgi:hypothetical protein
MTSNAQRVANHEIPEFNLAPYRSPSVKKSPTETHLAKRNRSQTSQPQLQVPVTTSLALARGLSPWPKRLGSTIG